jgi:hypothetical protein
MFERDRPMMSFLGQHERDEQRDLHFERIGRLGDQYRIMLRYPVVEFLFCHEPK